MDLKIDPEFQKLMPALPKEEITELETSIVETGCRDALKVWKEENILIDGHNRLGICQKRGKRYKLDYLSFSNRDEVIVWILRNQFGRRNLQKFQRAELALIMEAALSRLGKEVKIDAGKKYHKGAKKETPKVDPKKPKPLEQEEKKHNTIEKMAKSANLSATTMAKARVITKKATEKEKKELRAGNTTINKVYNKYNKKEKKKMAEQIEASNARELEVRPTLWDMSYTLFFKKYQVEKEIDLLVTDPPHFVGFEKYKDLGHFVDFVDTWMDVAFAKVKSTGHIYIFLEPEDLETYLSKLDFFEAYFKLTNILGWYVQNPDKSQVKKTAYWSDLKPIIHLAGHEARPLNIKAGTEERSSVQIFYAPDDVREIKHHPEQKPVDLIKRFIEHSTDKGDLVVDPFAGTGSTLLAAASMGRKAIGCDLDAGVLDKAAQRGCEVKWK